MAVDNVNIQKDKFFEYVNKCYGTGLSLHQRIIMAAVLDGKKVQHTPFIPKHLSYGNKSNIVFIDESSGGLHINGKEK